MDARQGEEKSERAIFNRECKEFEPRAQAKLSYCRVPGLVALLS